MSRYFTKSHFKKALECPTKLYYAAHAFKYRNSMAENTFMEALADGGHQIGAYSKLLYPNGIEVKGNS